jgi:hypothetical protein
MARASCIFLRRAWEPPCRFSMKLPGLALCTTAVLCVADARTHARTPCMIDGMHWTVTLGWHEGDLPDATRFS